MTEKKMTEEERQELESIRAELETIRKKMDSQEPLQWIYIARIDFLEDRLRRVIERGIGRSL